MLPMNGKHFLCNYFFFFLGEDLVKLVCLHYPNVHLILSCI
jgi:hypothetical protein